MCGSAEMELIDTAGVDLSRAGGSIDAAAQDMAHAQTEQAALVLLCVDASRPLTDWEQQEIAPCRAEASCLVVWTKCDAARSDSVAAAGELCTSSHTGQGIAELKAAIESVLTAQSADAAVVPGTAARCRESLELAAQSLRRAHDAAAELGEEFAAAEVRSALNDLGQVVGAVYTDDLLDRIFSRFCIGK
jgi:tRNA modification GTPase